MKIEKLERRYIGPDTGCGGATFSDVIDKINEIVDALNEKKEQKPHRVAVDTCEAIDKVREFDEQMEKEQKPASTEDMPYITDEHFYEREPADSFKYKLAEYMTRCCTKKEGPYGYEYGISAESILKMAEEELLKRGVVQKPVKWSEEDEDMRLEAIRVLVSGCERYRRESGCLPSWHIVINWLKSLRSQPQWKPSEEQMRCFEYAMNKVPKSTDVYGVLESFHQQLKSL